MTTRGAGAGFMASETVSESSEGVSVAAEVLPDSTGGLFDVSFAVLSASSSVGGFFSPSVTIIIDMLVYIR